MSSGLGAVHQGQQLGNDSLLDFSGSLLTLGRDGVNLINKNNGGCVLLSLLKRLE